MKDLKRRTTRGVIVSGISQAIVFLIRIGSLIVLARLLAPADFGVFGMVAAFTGILGIFRDAGLSAATVQREAISTEQTSTLFWINVAVGMGLALACALAAPLLVSFYKEPRLLLVTIVLGVGFVFNGFAAQHRAILQRDMRFGALSTIEIASLILSYGIGIGVGAMGGAYWALVLTNISGPAIGALGVWLALSWIPGLPKRGTGVRAMVKYGGTVTVNNLIVYLAYNADKVLLGRFLGPEVLGIYGRAYQLVTIPSDNIGGAIGVVAFPALARVQGDAERLRSYFLKGYGLFLSLMIPIGLGCWLFPSDIVLVLLGPKWNEAAGVFKKLAPIVIIFACLNPFGWLLHASGRAWRSLLMAVVIAPVVVLACAIGVMRGPEGVATGFSIAMGLLVVPLIAWARHGTLVSGMDVIRCLKPLFVSGAAGMIAVSGFNWWVARIDHALGRLVAETVILFGVYMTVLLFGFRRYSEYSALLKGLGGGRMEKEERTSDR